ncbi:MAG TPA: DUF1992 domain-containing protein [Burkholderiaceae bacterium]|nr:DUF1992 domain-containing protein [Burkholderiaceae bacterium]
MNELVERRIADAFRQRAFDDLPGQGRPLVLDDDRLVPEDQRIAMRILKNAGVLPPEVQALRELEAGAGRASKGCKDPASHAQRMLALVSLLESRGVSLASGAGLEYRHKLLRSVNK